MGRGGVIHIRSGMTVLSNGMRIIALEILMQTRRVLLHMSVSHSVCNSRAQTKNSLGWRQLETEHRPLLYTLRCHAHPGNLATATMLAAQALASLLWVVLAAAAQALGGDSETRATYRTCTRGPGVWAHWPGQACSPAAGDGDGSRCRIAML